MPVLRVASLAIVAIWIGGVAALGIMAAPLEMLERFRHFGWFFGGGVIALLVLRTLLGPRPRRLSIQMGLVAIMLASNAFLASPALAALSVAAGLAVFWIEARD